MENFYILVGKDKILIEEQRKKLIHKIGIELEENIIFYDFIESDFNEIMQCLSTYSFFSDKRCVVVTNFEDKKIDEKTLEVFLNYLKNPILEHFLILEVFGDIPNNAIFSELKRFGKIVSISNYTVEEIRKYTDSFLVQENIKVDSDALDEFLKRCENKYDLVKKELEKVSIYFEDEKENKILRMEDVVSLIPRNMEENIYSLTTYILEKNKTKALETLSDLLLNGEEAVRLLNVITKRIKEIVFTKILIEQKYTKADIAQYFGISSGKAYYLVKDCTRFSRAILEKYFSELIELDYKIKSGQMDKNTGLELFILKV